MSGFSSPRPTSVLAPFMVGWIRGLTYQNGTDATNDLNIAAGACVDSSGAVIFSVAVLTKQLDAAWAVGTNQGGRLGGAIADTDYNIWAIYRSDTGVSDIAFEATSASTPTLPSDYTHYRRIGWFKRVGGTIVAFTTYETQGGGLQLLWKAPTLDIDQANALTTARRTDAVKVPLTFSVDAIISVYIFDASAGFFAVVCCPDETDVAPSASAARLTTVQGVTSNSQTGQVTVRTSSAGLIAARATLATVDTYRVTTIGFIDARR